MLELALRMPTNSESLVAFPEPRGSDELQTGRD
jgi:hypothetical protein